MRFFAPVAAVTLVTFRTGGGIQFRFAEVLTITNSTISGNTAADDCCGLYVDVASSTTTITNSTVSGNRTNRNGGGISLDATSGILNLKFVTITNNIADLIDFISAERV